MKTVFASVLLGIFVVAPLMFVDSAVELLSIIAGTILFSVITVK